MGISAQISLYPLGKESLSQDIAEFVRILRSMGLQCEVGNMSTVVYGETDEIFDALKEAYSYIASKGGCVMVSTISNACPAQQYPDLDL
jgi:uncharacterized protein YqgV (UPF0045/DUF77 family)